MDSVQVFDIFSTFTGIYVVIDCLYLRYTDYKYKKPKFLSQLLSEKTLAVLERIKTSINRKVKLKELKKIRKVKQLERKAIQIAKEDLAALEVKTQQLRDFLDGQIAYTFKRTLNAEAEAQRHIDSLK